MKHEMILRCFDEQLAGELQRALTETGLDAAFSARQSSRDPFRSRAAISLDEIALVLGSAGTLSAIVKIVCAALARHKDRKVVLKRGETEITIEGHSIPDERDILAKLAPELMHDSEQSDS